MTGVKVSALRHPIFQPSKPDGPNGEFRITIENILENTLDMNGFMKYTKYTNIKNNVTIPKNITERFENFTALANRTELFNINTYFPIVDPLGPYLMYPQQCYAWGWDIESGKKHNSPVIAYIKTGNQIEEDIITQLDALFTYQRTLVNLLKSFSSVEKINEFLPGFF